MFDQDRWVEIWVTITRNKTRSLLTCFGVFWGILMLVLLLGAGTGLKNAMSKSINGFATNSIFLMAEHTSEPYKGFNKGREWHLHNKDVELLKENVTGIEYVSPIIWGNSSGKNVSYNTVAASYGVKGIYPAHFYIEGQVLVYGRFFNEIDTNEKRKVCLIGDKVNEVLFKNANSCGKYIKVNGIYYQIIGVIKQLAESVNIGGRSSETVFIPFTTMQQTLNQGTIVHFICFTGKRGYDMDKMEKEAIAVVKRNNSIAPNDPQAVRCFNISKQFQMFDLLFLGIDALIWLVGLGTLLSGIIGISNIMMVTVRERTREIGVRRAIGAKPFHIISQIMSESLILTFLAGILGLSLGVYLLDFVDQILMANPEESPAILHPQVNIGVALIATGVLLFSGLLAGLIPAWRAMQIKAIDAIRDE